MIGQTLAIIRNTFFESIRQPVMLVILIAATLLIILSNPFSAFTMEDDQRMYVDIGMSTIFLAGALLAAMIATNVLTREIDNRTVLTVISKPVMRPLFVIGKYIGVAGAILVGCLFLSLAFMLVEVHGTLQTAATPYHFPVIVFGIGAVLIGTAVGVWSNFFYGNVFASTVIVVTTPLLALAYALSLFFQPDFATREPAVAFRGDLWLGLATLVMAIMVLTAIAIAASTRLNQVMTLIVTVAVFLLGLLSDWLFGRPIGRLRNVWMTRAREEGATRTVEETVLIQAPRHLPEEITHTYEIPTVPLTEFAREGEMMQYVLFKIPYSIVPNYQVLWLSDALTQHHRIPLDYVATSLIYGLFYIVAALCVAVILFQRREVG